MFGRCTCQSWFYLDVPKIVTYFQFHGKTWFYDEEAGEFFSKKYSGTHGKYATGYSLEKKDNFSEIYLGIFIQKQNDIRDSRS